MPRLWWAAFWPRRKIRHEVFPFAESWPHPKMEKGSASHVRSYLPQLQQLGDVGGCPVSLSAVFGAPTG
jgi:hypothetical protein